MIPGQNPRLEIDMDVEVEACAQRVASLTGPYAERLRIIRLELKRLEMMARADQMADVTTNILLDSIRGGEEES